MLEPESILHRVWQKDTPPKWQVYTRWRLRPWVFGCVASIVIAIVPLFLALFLQRFWSNYLALAVGFIFGAVVIGALSLVFATKEDTEPLKDGEVPPALLVITPDGVVEFLNLQEDIRTIPFAYLNALQRKAPNAEYPAGSLELVDQDGDITRWATRVPFGSRNPAHQYDGLYKQVVAVFEKYQLQASLPDTDPNQHHERGYVQEKDVVRE